MCYIIVPALSQKKSRFLSNFDPQQHNNDLSIAFSLVALEASYNIEKAFKLILRYSIVVLLYYCLKGVLLSSKALPLLAHMASTHSLHAYIAFTQKSIEIKRCKLIFNQIDGSC